MGLPLTPHPSPLTPHPSQANASPGDGSPTRQYNTYSYSNSGPRLRQPLPAALMRNEFDDYCEWKKGGREEGRVGRIEG